MCITSATLCVTVLDIRELPLSYKNGEGREMFGLCIGRLDFFFFLSRWAGSIRPGVV